MPTYSIKSKLMLKGINGERIRVTGIPVRKEFLRSGSRTDADEKNLSFSLWGGFGCFNVDYSFYYGSAGMRI